MTTQISKRSQGGYRSLIGEEKGALVFQLEEENGLRGLGPAGSPFEYRDIAHLQRGRVMHFRFAHQRSITSDVLFIGTLDKA